jgi:hypothetical protein
MLTTHWRSANFYVNGDPTLKLQHSNSSFPHTKISCTDNGDHKWIGMGLDLPPGAKIISIIICYVLSSSKSYIAQVTLSEQTKPDSHSIKHDDATALVSTTPVCATSLLHPASVFNGAVNLNLRLNFNSTNDYIMLGAVGIEY